MEPINKRIGFIGAGNMAEAMIGAIINTRTFSPGDIYVSDVDSSRIESLSTTYSVNAVNENIDIVEKCEIIVFAIKPQQMDAVLSDLADRNGFSTLSSGRKIFISIAAGIRIKTLERSIYFSKQDNERLRLPIMRVMPNTPALVCAGMCAICTNESAVPEDLEIAQRLLSSMGKVVVVDEEKMDAVTAISGSGPAYCYYFIESMIAAGEQMGMSVRDASELTVATFSGALRLLESRPGENAESLRRKVTSPGGTTEAAISVLDGDEVKASIINAVLAAAERSRQLSGEED